MPLPPTFPDLVSLDVFSSVVALGSVSKAAAAHGMSQPSASARLQQLERQLGVTLLDRSPTGSTPTPAGQLVAGWTAGVLQAADQLRAGLEALRASTEHRLRLAASFTIAEYLLPAWLERFRQRHPDDSVELDVANSSEVLVDLAAGRADLGFVESPGPFTDVDETIVGADELVVIVAPGHPWARRSSIAADEVAATALVLREVGSGTREFFDAAFRRVDLAPPVPAFELGSTAAIKNAVASSSLPGVLSRVAIVGDAAAGRLHPLAVDGLDLHRTLRAVWPSDRPLPATARALLDVV